MSGPQANPSDDQIPRTDEELAAKLRGQLAGAVKTLQELAGRAYHISVDLCSDDCDQWLYRLTISKTRFL